MPEGDKRYDNDATSNLATPFFRGCVGGGEGGAETGRKVMSVYGMQVDQVGLRKARLVNKEGRSDRLDVFNFGTITYSVPINGPITSLTN